MVFNARRLSIYRQKEEIKATSYIWVNNRSFRSRFNGQIELKVLFDYW